MRVSVKCIPHPNPKALIELWARLVVEEILRQEQEQQTDEEASRS